MSFSVSRAAIAAACLVCLAGCETTSTPGNPMAKLGDIFAAKTEPAATEGDPTGSVEKPRGPADALPKLTPELMGDDPYDDLNIGKKYFRQGSYGLAERHFRKSVELHPQDAESWIGLAASYDRLRRFDLADRAYDQAIKLVGPTPVVLNNQGFSYMLRGDYPRARAILLTARAKDPQNPYVANNLRLLAASARKAKGIN